MDRLTSAAALNRPEAGDYLEAPPEDSHRLYLVARSDGHSVLAVAVSSSKADASLIDTTWPDLARAGFLLRRYDDMQNRRMRMLVILVTLACLAALNFVIASPLSLTQAVSMFVALMLTLFSVAIINGFKRDFLWRKLAMTLSAPESSSPGQP